MWICYVSVIFNCQDTDETIKGVKIVCTVPAAHMIYPDLSHNSQPDQHLFTSIA